MAKGFLQKYGVDYFETYAPVAKLTTVRVVLAIAVHRKLYLHQLDVKTAFLYGCLKEEIYLAIPDGMTKMDGKSLKLAKSLYGLKQSPRCWNEKFNEFLLSVGFQRSQHDYCMYTRINNDKSDMLIIVMYVDDLLIAGSSVSNIKKLKRELSEKI